MMAFCLNKEEILEDYMANWILWFGHWRVLSSLLLVLLKEVETVIVAILQMI